MEFDEMKKIWDTQNNEPIYGINEKALHNRILSKKRQAYHITNFSELLIIIVYIGAGAFVLALNTFKPGVNIAMYCLSAWMFMVAFYMLFSRIRRIKASHRFDRSMSGDLNHALSVATYQVRISAFGRWNILPIGILTVLGVWEGGKSIWAIAGVVIFFVLVSYASGWEHNIYKTRKRELEILQDKLENEDLDDQSS